MVEVVVDNAIVCKSVGQIIEGKYPHITYNGYIAHNIDLVLEDIEKIGWVHKIVNEAITNIKFITNHHKSQALFREFSSKVNNMELLRLGDTRFGTNFIMLGKVAKSQNTNSTNDCEFRMEKEDVGCAFLNNQFWKSLTLIVKVTEPIFNLMRLVDSGKPTTGKFYEYCDQLMEKINEMDMD